MVFTVENGGLLTNMPFNSSVTVSTIGPLDLASSVLLPLMFPIDESLM